MEYNVGDIVVLNKDKYLFYKRETNFLSGEPFDILKNKWIITLKIKKDKIFFSDYEMDSFFYRIDNYYLPIYINNWIESPDILHIQTTRNKKLDQLL